MIVNILFQTFWLAGIAAIHRIGLPVEPRGAYLIAAFPLAVAAALALRPTWRVVAGTFLALAACAALAAAAPAAEAASLLATAVTAAFALGARPGKGCAVADIVGVAAFGTLEILRLSWADAWSALDAYSFGCSKIAAWSGGADPSFGASASGALLALLTVAILAARTLFSSGVPRTRTFVACAVALAIPVAVVAAGSRVPFDPEARNSTGPTAFLFLVQLAAIPVLALLLAATRPAGGLSVRVPSGGIPALRFAGSAAVLLLVLGGSSVVDPGRPAPRPPKRSVLVLDRASALGDFHSPTWSRLGWASTGLYGEFLRLLSGTGRDVRREAVVLTPADLSGVDLLVVIDPCERFRDSEVAAVRAFVAAGGALLVLSDHTDVLGVREPTNQLTEPFGVELRFDTAMEATRAFLGTLEVHGRSCLPPTLDPLSAQILHGASLRVKSPARPWIVGRAMFGDHGDRAKAGKDGFLGDYTVDPATERVGDLVLAALADFGRGRVAVFGDTSSFQNVALPRSSSFLLDVVATLEGGAPHRATTVRLASAILALLAAGLAAWPGARMSFRGIALAVVAAMPLAGTLALAGAGRDDLGRGIESLPARSVAVVHTKGTPYLDTDLFRDKSVVGFFTCLARCGWFPWCADLRRVPDLDACGLVVLPAFAEPLDDVTAARLVRYLEEGGSILVSCGLEESAGVRGFLGKLGMEILPTPLGGAPILTMEKQRDYQGPQFAEAWPVGFRKDAEVETVWAYEGLPVVVRRRVGRGQLVVVGDSWILDDKYLEGETKYSAGNVALVRSLLEGFAGPPKPPEGK